MVIFSWRLRDDLYFSLIVLDYLVKHPCGIMFSMRKSVSWLYDSVVLVWPSVCCVLIEFNHDFQF